MVFPHEMPRNLCVSGTGHKMGPEGYLRAASKTRGWFGARVAPESRTVLFVMGDVECFSESRNPLKATSDKVASSLCTMNVVPFPKKAVPVWNYQQSRRSVSTTSNCVATKGCKMYCFLKDTVSGLFSGF